MDAPPAADEMRAEPAARADDAEAWEDDPWEWGGEDGPGEATSADEDAPSPTGTSRGTRARLGGVLRDVGDRLVPGDPSRTQRTGRTAEGACRRCGAHVREADRFCSSCGTSLRAGAPGAARGGAVAPPVARIGLPLLLGLAVVVLVALLLRDPLSGVRSDLGDELRPPVGASRALGDELVRLPAGGSPRAVAEAARAVQRTTRDARANVGALDVPPEASGDVRRATDALSAQSRWATAVLAVLADPTDGTSVADRARSAQRALGELDGLVDAGEARAGVRGTAQLDAAVGERRRRAAADRRRRAEAARRLAPFEGLLRATAEASRRQREARATLGRLARAPTAGTADPQAFADLQEARTALGQSQSGRAEAATRAAGLEADASLRPSREALAAAYRAAEEEAGALTACLAVQGSADPSSAARTCREQAAAERGAAARAAEAFARAYVPQRRAAGLDGRPRP